MNTKASRLKVGLDAPWVTSWSQEPQLGLTPCASVEGALAIGQGWKPGIGRPLPNAGAVAPLRKACAKTAPARCAHPPGMEDEQP